MNPSNSPVQSPPESFVPSEPLPFRLFSLGFPQRLFLFAVLFTAEWFTIAMGFRLRLAIVIGIVFLAFGYVKARSSFHAVSREMEQAGIGWALLAAHVAVFLCFLGLGPLFYRSNPPGSDSLLIKSLWYGTGGLSIVLAGFAFVPVRLALQFARSTGWAWAIALIVGVVEWHFANSLPFLYGQFIYSATDFTFAIVENVLRHLVPGLLADRTTMLIGNAAFAVNIYAPCSGLEGTGLMLIFSVAWLGFFHREFRFPRALLLIPVSLVIIWTLNAARIIALILIGISFSPAVAMGGFHSQAGWIAFNGVALAFAIVSRKLPWFRTPAGAEVEEKIEERNPTAAYLVPFLAILAAAMVSRAASSAFEWPYALRLFAATTALLYFRRSYDGLNWRFGWLSPAVGVLVFALWLALDSLAGKPAESSIGAGLALLPPVSRAAWILFRTVAAVVTVPIAEELAFRGFMIRRLQSDDFELLDSRQYTWISLAVSSVAFGLMHGDRWVAGTVAGLLYAGVYLWKGRIGDAAVAHATTNALLAAWVLYFGSWHLW